jgi:uncharacterized protein
MSNFDPSPKHSPLAQPVTRNGQTVDVEINDDGHGGWLLEVVDAYGNFVVWDEPFRSDRDALDEALRSIDGEGIDSLIGLPSLRQDARAADDSPSNDALSDAELEELDAFLASDVIGDTSMDVATLDGFLTALAIGQSMVPLSDWLPWVWDMDKGEAGPQFGDADQVSRIVSLLVRHYNAVVGAFDTDPASREPLFWRDDCWGTSEWCEGFILGFMFDEEAWSLLAFEQPAWFAPFLYLGSDDVIDMTDSAGDAGKWMSDIAPALLRIHAHWKPMRAGQPPGQFLDDRYSRKRGGGVTLVRDGPKIGRNDPCPCGSGKKFKKCCGADGAPPPFH